jgi:hypothetical protein
LDKLAKEIGNSGYGKTAQAVDTLDRDRAARLGDQCAPDAMFWLSGVIRRRASMNTFATGPVLSTASTGIELRKPSVVTLHTTASFGNRTSASETAARTNPMVIAAIMGLVIDDDGNVFIWPERLSKTLFPRGASTPPSVTVLVVLTAWAVFP